MATVVNTTTIVTDDLDGKSGAATVKFGLDGKTYTIDLTPFNENNLRQSLAKYVAAATEEVPTPARRTRRANGTRPRTNTDSATIRAWAKANGLAVGTRGRIDSEIVEAFHAAQAPEPTEADAPQDEKKSAVEMAKALAVLHDKQIENASANAS